MYHKNSAMFQAERVINVYELPMQILEHFPSVQMLITRTNARAVVQAGLRNVVQSGAVERHKIFHGSYGRRQQRAYLF